MGAILIRYGETGLKTHNVKARFIGQLVSNIEDLFMAAGLECTINTVQGRHILTTPDSERGVDILSRAFGLVSVSPVDEFPSGMEELCEAVGNWSRDRLSPGQSFAIRARRAGTHPYTSMDVNKEAGSAVFLANEDKGVKVDLGGPDVLIEVEVRGRSAFVFSGRVPGPGGLPYGSGGRMVCYLGSERDAAAAWMLMRRGCRTYFYHTDQELANRCSVALGKWVPGLRSRMLDPDDESVGSLAAALEREVVYRKAMGFISGAAVDDVEAGRVTRPEGEDILLLYPLVGFGAPEVKVRLEALGLGLTG